MGERKSKSDYQFYKTHGICVACHQENALPERVHCLACLLDKRAKDREYKRQQKSQVSEEEKLRRNEQSRIRYQKRREAGICKNCHRPVYKNYSRCYEHHFANNLDGRLTYQESHIQREADQCRWCRKPVAYGRTFCQECLELNQKRAEYARTFINRKNHPWRRDNEVIFGVKNEVLKR